MKIQARLCTIKEDEFVKENWREIDDNNVNGNRKIISLVSSIFGLQDHYHLYTEPGEDYDWAVTCFKEDRLVIIYIRVIG